MIIVGHRGARGLAPENTVAALRKGLEHDADMLEIDVRVTKDNIPVLHHNLTIRDGSGQRLKIRQSTLKELQAHKPDLATLEDALGAVKGKVPIYVEIKRGEALKPILKLIKQHAKEPLFIASKSQKVLRFFHEALPDITCIVIEAWSGFRARQRCHEVNTRHVAMNQLWLWKWYIKPVAHGGWKLYAYTLNNPKKARRWETYGLYAVITDYPDRLV